MIVLIDSINAPVFGTGPIPQAILHAPAVGAYDHGNSWPTIGPYSQARPDLVEKGWIVSITLTALGSARAYDIEPGGGTNQNIGRFMEIADRRFGLPWLYTFASNVEAMLQWALKSGYHQDRDFYVWSAHQGAGHHICGPGVCQYPRADGTQCGFAPENCDFSLLNDYMLPSHKPVPMSPYAIFPTNLDVRLPNHGNERLTVEKADGALQHARVYKVYLQGKLYPELKLYRDRLYRVSKYEPPDFTRLRKQADWSGGKRGIRWQLINDRMKKIESL